MFEFQSQISFLQLEEYVTANSHEILKLIKFFQNLRRLLKFQNLEQWNIHLIQKNKSPRSAPCCKVPPFFIVHML